MEQRHARSDVVKGIEGQGLVIASWNRCGGWEVAILVAAVYDFGDLVMVQPEEYEA